MVRYLKTDSTVKRALPFNTAVPSTASKLAAVALAAFFLARTALFGQSVPFGLGFVAGLSGANCFAAALGAAIGYFFPILGTGGLGYVAAAAMVASVRFVLIGKFKGEKTPMFSALLAVAACLVAAVPMLFASFSVRQLAVRLAECAVCGCTAAAVCVCRKSLENSNRRSLPVKETVCAICVVGLLISSLGWIRIGDVGLVGILAAVVILCAVSGGQGVAGAAMGAALGFFMCATGRIDPWMTAALALGGLVAGIAAQAGHIGSGIAYTTTIAVYTLMSGGEGAGAVYEAAIGAGIYIFMPKKSRSFIAQLFAPPAELPRLDGLKKAVSMRLSFASKALCDVSDTVENVANKLEKVDNPPLERVITSLEGQVCGGCSMRCYCWEECREKTVSNIIMFVRGESAEPTPHCSRQERLTEASKHAYSEYKSRCEATKRIREIREVLTDQFSGVADLLAEVAEEFERERLFDHRAAADIESALRSVDIIPSDIGCSIDRYGRMTVEIRVSTSDRARFNKMTLLREVSAACGREFEPPSIYASGRGTLITLAQKATLSADVGLASLTCGDGKLCGDTATIFADGRGHSIMMLSDGMGTGGRAAVDSAMVTGLMERLIKAGFGYDSALRIVNSALLFKSADESLATVDVCSIDLFTGRAELYKAGACPTIVLRSGRAGIAECTSFPAGILREVSFDTAAITLSRGDVAVMFSDGVTNDGTDWICNELRSYNGNMSAQQLAERIADSARRRRSDGHDDDITVAVTVIS